MASDIGAFVSQAMFVIIALVVGGLVAASKKRRQEQETQEQLRRVDEAIRQARQRAGTGRVEQPVGGYVVASPAFQAGAQATSSASVPFAIPVADPEGPDRPGAWELEHAAPAAPAPVAAPRAPDAFAPPTAEELREAMVWRELFAPCLAMRS